MVLPYINMNLPQIYTCSPSWTLLLPPSQYHLSGLSQCTSPKHPVLCIKPGLAILKVKLKLSDQILWYGARSEAERFFPRRNRVTVSRWRYQSHPRIGSVNKKVETPGSIKMELPALSRNVKYELKLLLSHFSHVPWLQVWLYSSCAIFDSIFLQIVLFD